MKKVLLTVASAGLMLCASTFAATTTTTTTTPAPDSANLSYAMGFKTGQAMKARSITVVPAQFSQGLEDGYSGAKPRLSEPEMQKILTDMQQAMMKKMQATFKEVSAKNEKDGDDFLAKNGKLPGVVTTASGLEYKEIDKGDGESPKATDTVTVNYEGTLINGTVFDSSYKRGKPASFQVNQVIQGWQEALQMMKPGATWMLYIPAKLAYGSQGSMGSIGPNETLIFKVNLISVKK